jgi:hypothetical protein
MPSALSSVRDVPGDRDLRQSDDDSATIAPQIFGYYDPDSAAYDETAAVSTTILDDATDEGLPVRELVTA